MNFCTLVVSLKCPWSRHTLITTTYKYLQWQLSLCRQPEHSRKHHKWKHGCHLLWCSVGMRVQVSMCQLMWWQLLRYHYLMLNIWGRWAIKLGCSTVHWPPVRDVRTTSSIHISVVYRYINLDLNTKNKPILKIKLMKYGKVKRQQSLGIESKTPGFSRQYSITVL